MMKLLSLLLVAQGARAEFGRYRDGSSIRSLEKDAFVDEESTKVFLEFEKYMDHSMSMSMSMSMSYSTGTGGGSGGSSGGRGGNSGGAGGSSSPWSTPAPTDVPTVAPTLADSSAPSTSSAPSITESSVPSASPTVVAPAASLFECTDQGVVLAGTPGIVTTPISLTILYEAESTEDSTDGFLSDLEQSLFSIALTAALECDGTTRRELHEAMRKLSTSSSVVGSCNTTEDTNTCFTMETTMDFELNENVDPDYAAFLSYTALQSAMDNYTADSIDTVVRLDYLAPTPNMPGGSTSPPAQASSTRGVSPLVIGACAAMVAGGTLALYVWVHNRRTRNKRHVELEEDNSLSPVSFFSAERDPYEDA